MISTEVDQLVYFIFWSSGLWKFVGCNCTAAGSMPNNAILMDAIAAASSNSHRGYCRRC